MDYSKLSYSEARKEGEKARARSEKEEADRLAQMSTRFGLMIEEKQFDLSNVVAAYKYNLATGKENPLFQCITYIPPFESELFIDLLDAYMRENHQAKVEKWHSGGMITFAEV